MVKNNEIQIKEITPENNKTDYWKWFFRILVLAIFIMCCLMTHYLLKLWEIWKVVEKLPK